MNNQIASREIYWNLSAPINQFLMYGLFAISAVICGWGFYRRIQLWSAGKKDDLRLKNFPKRFLLAIKYVLFQKKVNQKKEVRLFHTLILWGFLVLLFTTTMVFIQQDLGIAIYKGEFYLAVTLLSDIFGFGLLLGLGIAFHTRYIEKPDRLHNTPSDLMMLSLLTLLVVQGFALEAIRIKVTQDPWAWASPVGYTFSLFFWGLSDNALKTLHFITWWFHTITVFGFFALLPYSKLMHILASSANLFFMDIDKAKGSLKYIGDIEEVMTRAMESDEELSLGVSSIKDLTWKQRLDLDACTSCGRCQEVCPAYNSGKMLSPKWLILDTRDHMLGLRTKETNSAIKTSFQAITNILDKIDNYLLKNLLLVPSGRDNSASFPYQRAKNPLVQNSVIALAGSEEDLLAGGVINSDVFWACTTCRACMEVCPVGIEHVDLITDVRRSMALMQGEIPSEAQTSLRAIETRGNPFGPAESRADWAKDLKVPLLSEGDKVEILYWVGCVSAYDKRKQEIARSMVKILNASGLSWGMLGSKENCTGDPARRLGEENLFQQSAKKNIELLSKISFGTMVANCPHCFNTFKNEYPDVGSFAKDVKIVHHSHLIKELIAKDKLKLTKDFDKSVTFHDPCYLGRYNDTYEEPREVLIQLGGKAKLKEMKDSKNTAMCCGAGGGHFWMDMKVGERVNVQRVDQVAETGAEIVATGCPFCMQMLEDGIKLTEREDKIAVKDIAELVASALM